MVYYYIFETTNKITGEKYRGIHHSKVLKDNYLGSSVELLKAIKKYGKENFERKELEYCLDLNELIERKSFYITEQWLARPDTYNKGIGGLASTKKVIKKSEEAKRNTSLAMKRLYEQGFSPVEGKDLGVRTEEQRKNISDGMKAVYANGSYSGCKGKSWEKEELTEEQREVLCRAQRLRYIKKESETSMVKKNTEIILKLKM